MEDEHDRVASNDSDEERYERAVDAAEREPSGSYYAAGELASAPDGTALHLTIAFMGAFDARGGSWKRVHADLLQLPLPIEIRFVERAMLGPQRDIEVVRVACTSAVAENAIRAFHRAYVEPGHISERHLDLHVTSKGHTDALLRQGTATIEHVYVKERLTKTIVASVAVE